jgi:hypothetical protein
MPPRGRLVDQLRLSHLGINLRPGYPQRGNQQKCSTDHCCSLKQAELYDSRYVPSSAELH